MRILLAFLGLALMAGCCPMNMRQGHHPRKRGWSEQVGAKPVHSSQTMRAAPRQDLQRKHQHELDAVTQQLRAVRGQLVDIQKQIKGLSEENRALREMLYHPTVEMLNPGGRRYVLEPRDRKKVWEAIERHTGMIDLPKAGWRMPPINGQIVGVSNKANIVVINRGEGDNVRIGFEFTIYRGTAYVAKMVIEKVFPNQAAGRVIEMSRRDKVQVGDKVATRIS